MGRCQADIDWSKTKNGKPHADPGALVGRRVDRVDQAERERPVFSVGDGSSGPVSHGTLYSFMWRQRDREVIPVVTNRDLRRTWKTLAGKAGVSKEIRRPDPKSTPCKDVSSKSYDRWSYMPEKRAAMNVWNKFVQVLLSRKRLKRLPRRTCLREDKSPSPPIWLTASLRKQRSRVQILSGAPIISMIYV